MNFSPASHLDDEALSAALDAAAAGAAGAANPDQGSAAAHLAGCAQCTGRLEQLAGARAALASAPVESLDELTRRRLVARALAESIGPTAHRRPRHPALVGGLAAAILALLVAVPFLTRNGRTTDRTLSSAAGPAQAGPAFLGDLGEVSDPEAIRMRLGPTTMAAAQPGDSARQETQEQKAAGGSPGSTTAPPRAADRLFGAVPGSGEAPVAPAAPVPSPLSGSSGAEAARHRDSATQTSALADPSMTRRCSSALAAGPAQGARLVATGVGILQGTPVVVSVFATPSGDVAYITAQDGCGLLRRYSL